MVQQEEWIIDGNFSSTMELRLQACNTVIFLDYPTEVCLEGVRQRKGKARSDIPWVETEEDPEFMEFIREFNTQRRPHIMELLKQYSDKKIIIFTSREEAEELLKQM